jgi:hypothetical protein
MDVERAQLQSVPMRAGKEFALVVAPDRTCEPDTVIRFSRVRRNSFGGHRLDVRRRDLHAGALTFRP